MSGSSEASDSEDEDRVKNPSEWDFITGVFLTSSFSSFFNILTEAEGFRDDDVDEGIVVVASTVVVSGTSFCSILHWKFENLFSREFFCACLANIGSLTSLVEFQSSSLLDSRLKL